MFVSEVMNQNVIYAEVPGNREQVLKKLIEKKISGLPVVKKGTKMLVGIITREDLLKHYDEEQIALIMNTDVVTVSPDSPLHECIRIMRDTHYRRIPVVSNKELKGIITVGDIVHKVLTKSNSSLKVKDLMQSKFLTCWSNTPLYIVGKIMQMAKQHVSLAINDDERIVGIISNTDLIKHVEVKIEEKKSVLKSSSESQEWDWETSSVLYITKGKIALPKTPLHQVMSTPCITIGENSSVGECAIKMQKYDIDQLLVTNAKNEVVGMIFDTDLLRSL
ncbi:MAG: CBS domain-containing protein [Candidatus Methanomethyliales bacterium]|nr:CBS domain-containing protein [Candidatus Methanomethylicales archaeon]